MYPTFSVSMGLSGPIKTLAPVFIIPAFSNAIFSREFPKIFVWSNCTDVITDRDGFDMTFVESNLPPNPTSNTMKSHFSSWNIMNASAVVNSKKVADILFALQIFSRLQIFF